MVRVMMWSKDGEGDGVKMVRVMVWSEDEESKHLHT